MSAGDLALRLHQTDHSVDEAALAQAIANQTMLIEAPSATNS